MRCAEFFDLALPIVVGTKKIVSGGNQFHLQSVGSGGHKLGDIQLIRFPRQKSCLPAIDGDPGNRGIYTVKPEIHASPGRICIKLL